MGGYGSYCAMGGDEVKNLINKDNICAFSLGISLLACVILGYNDNVACTIAGSLGGVITGRALAGGGSDGTKKP